LLQILLGGKFLRVRAEFLLGGLDSSHVESEQALADSRWRQAADLMTVKLDTFHRGHHQSPGSELASS